MKFKHLESNIIMPIGACTFHPYTLNFIASFINKNNVSPIFFFENCYRPVDNLQINGIRSDIHTQLQIMCINLDGKKIITNLLIHLFGLSINHEIIFLEDNWSAPTMYAYGYGWEVRIFNLEVAQITYFKRFGNIKIIEYNILEITIGIERLLMLINRDKFINHTNNNNIKQFKEKIQNIKNDELEMQINNLIELRCVNNYNQFLNLNNLFNILDSRNYFSSCIKNMYLFKISKIFKIFFNDIISSLKVS